MSKQVFISYSSKDGETPQEICRLLEAQGLTCWIAPRDITPGNKYGEEIVRAISAAGVVVLVLSENSNASEQVEQEIGLANEKRVRRIVFRLQDIKPAGSLEYCTAGSHYCDAWNRKLEPAVRDLADAVRTQLSLPRLEAGPAVPSGKRKSSRRVALALAAVAAACALLLAFPLLRGGASPDGALVEAASRLDSGDASGAAALYREHLADHPEADQARYGLGYALLHLGEETPAAEAFGAIKEASLRDEGLAALAYRRDGEKARPLLEALKRPYPRVLTARLDAAGGGLEKALAALRSVGVSEFEFRWQRDEYLLALGQALLRTDDPDGALAQFLLVEGKASPLTAAAAENYARMIQEKREATKRTEIREQVARVKTLLESGENNGSPADDWTSRPLVVCILPCRPGSGQLAADSGLADLFPWMLGQTLPAKTPVTLVDRELVSEVLMEQELSASLGSDAGRLRLGKVLGARILMDCSFIALMGKEYLVPRLVDTESTASIPMEKTALVPGTDPDVWTGEVANKAAAAMAAAYPVRGRLEAGDGGFTANIGAKVGVKPGMRFLLLDGPDPAAVRSGCVAVAGPGVTDDSCPATIEGCPVDAAPEGGFYIMAEEMLGNV